MWGNQEREKTRKKERERSRKKGNKERREKGGSEGGKEGGGRVTRGRGEQWLSIGRGVGGWISGCREGGGWCARMDGWMEGWNYLGRTRLSRFNRIFLYSFLVSLRM